MTFVDTSVMPNTSTTITDYLKSSTAASTYAPKASPTFTGTVTFPDASVTFPLKTIFSVKVGLTSGAYVDDALDVVKYVEAAFVCVK